MQPRIYHLDACVDGQKRRELMLARDFKIESHYARFTVRPLPEDEVWIPPIAEEGRIILTGDRGAGDGRMLKVLQEVRPDAIIVSAKLANNPLMMVELLEKHRKSIERAFEREGPLLIWLNAGECSASRHCDHSTRLRILGNGTLVGR